MTEHDLQNLIRLELTKMGFCVFRANVGKGKTLDGRYFDTGLPKGFPDLFAVKDDKICFLEIKLPKGKLSDNQKHFIKLMKDKYNTNVYVCRSVGDAIKATQEVWSGRRANNIK